MMDMLIRVDVIEGQRDDVIEVTGGLGSRDDVIKVTPLGLRAAILVTARVHLHKN